MNRKPCLHRTGPPFDFGSRAWLLVLLFAVATAGCRTTQSPPGSAPPAYRTIAYVTGRADLARIDAAKLTHINYAFAHVSDSGTVYFRHPNAPAYLAQLQSLKARNPRLKLLVSVGGWGADGFSDAALTDTSRLRFARSAAEMVERYALDGIDMDWEYPGQPGPGIKFRPEDRQNFTLMLQAMRAQLDSLGTAHGRTGGDRYLLTIASAGSPTYFAHTEMDRLHAYLDFINVMTYDLYGVYSSTTGHHTGLLTTDVPGATPQSGASDVERHLEAGIPPHKLVIGAAFYGKSWTGVQPAYNGRNQPYERYVGTYPYEELVRDYIDRRGFRRHWDETARAPYLWNPDSTTFISYEDPASLAEKVRYVRTNGLGGIMYWEHSHDPDEVLLDAIYRSFNGN